MDVLLDTVTFLWWMAGDARLGPGAAKLVRDPSNRVHLSAASAWEIAIKHGAGKLSLPRPPAEWLPEARARHGVLALPVEEEDALHVERLPRLHGDPFDRLLVAQSILRGLALVTPDVALRAYPCRTLWP
jgi:PIN domain nuclease of toxin-antitoxin system